AREPRIGITGGLGHGTGGILVNRVGGHGSHRDAVGGIVEVLPDFLGGLIGAGALLAEAQFFVFEVTGDSAGCRSPGSRGRIIVVNSQFPGGIGQVRIIAADLVKKIRLGIVVAGDGRRGGGQNHPAGGIVFGKIVPLGPAARVLVNTEHHLAIGVGIDDIGIVIGESFDSFCGPTVGAGGIATGGIGIGVGAHSAGSQRITVPQDHIFCNAV